MSEKYLYIITQAPYSCAVAVEAIDAALMSANFDLQVSVLLIHDGVFQIKKGQGDVQKNTGKIFKALSDYGVDGIYVDQLSLDARDMSQTDLLVSADKLKSEQIRAMIADHDQVLVF